MKQLEPTDAIIISVPENHPEHLYGYFEKLPGEDKFTIRTITTDRGPMAGIEYLMPTAVIAYLVKPFFEAFLQEAGKDFYTHSKSKLKEFIAENRKLKYRLIAASGSTNKLSKAYSQSSTVSIKAMLHSHLMVTVLFDESIPEGEMDDLMEGLFASLNLLYDRCQKEAPESETNPKSSHAHQIFMIADLELREWKLLSREQMHDMFGNK